MVDFKYKPDGDTLKGFMKDNGSWIHDDSDLYGNATVNDITGEKMRPISKGRALAGESASLLGGAYRRIRPKKTEGQKLFEKE